MLVVFSTLYCSRLRYLTRANVRRNRRKYPGFGFSGHSLRHDMSCGVAIVTQARALGRRWSVMGLLRECERTTESWSTEGRCISSGGTTDHSGWTTFMVFISVRDLEKIKSIHLYKNAWGSGKCSLYGRKFSVSLFAVYVCISCGARVVGEHSLRTSVTVFGLIAKDRKD